MLEDLTYHQLNILMYLGENCRHIELKHLVEFSKEVSKYTNLVNDSNLFSEVEEFLYSRTTSDGRLWSDMLNEADYDDLARTLQREFP